MVALTSKKIHQSVAVSSIDLTLERSKVCELMVNACKELGFFQVENHGVSKDVVSRVEREGHAFFSKPACQKQRAGPPSPFGYGCKNIGFNGDQGELEYILLPANPPSISHISKNISSDPTNFSCAVNDYIEEVRKLACYILEMVAEGLDVQDKSIFSKLIQDANNDSCFRINHYPSDDSTHLYDDYQLPKSRIGFGEHSDPQILTILRSNNVGGLQVLSKDGSWIAIPPDPDKFCVFVGDAFQVLTNGKFTSVRHRAMANSSRSRMSIVYFAAPPLSARISPIPQVISTESPGLYKCFTWGEYKSTVYSLRLADRRLDLFRK